MLAYCIKYSELKVKGYFVSTIKEDSRKVVLVLVIKDYEYWVTLGSSRPSLSTLEASVAHPMPKDTFSL